MKVTRSALVAGQPEEPYVGRDRDRRCCHRTERAGRCENVASLHRLLETIGVG